MALAASSVCVWAVHNATASASSAVMATNRRTNPTSSSKTSLSGGRSRRGRTGVTSASSRGRESMAASAAASHCAGTIAIAILYEEQRASGRAAADLPLAVEPGSSPPQREHCSVARGVTLGTSSSFWWPSSESRRVARDQDSSTEPNRGEVASAHRLMGATSSRCPGAGRGFLDCVGQALVAHDPPSLGAVLEPLLNVGGAGTGPRPPQLANAGHGGRGASNGAFPGLRPSHSATSSTVRSGSVRRSRTCVVPDRVSDC